MKHLTLSADYMDFSLRDERVGEVSKGDLGLTQDIIDDLRVWNSKYQTIIPKSMKERGLQENALLIEELDAEGLSLSVRLEEAIPGQVKVRYFSEGRLKKIL